MTIESPPQSRLLSRATNVPGDSLGLIDLLRVVAAWAVLAWHLADVIHFKRMPVFGSAAFAVDIFMNVSGFLMLFHFVLREPREPWNAPRTWRAFWLRRFFRIAPLYYVLLLLSFLLRDSLGLRTFDLRSLLFHTTFLFGLVPSQVTNTAFPDWSLSLEMQFYACFPFLALLARRVSTGLFFALASTVAALANGSVGYYVGSPPKFLGWLPQPSVLPLKLHVFAVGIVAAAVYFHGPRELRSWWFVPGFLAYALTCKENYMRLMFVFYLALYLGCLLPATWNAVGGVTRSVNECCGRSRFLKWAAELSYSSYLLHSMVFIFLFRAFPVTTSEEGMTVTRYLGWLLIALLCVNGVGTVCFYLVERPGIQTGKTLVRSLARRPA